MVENDDAGCSLLLKNDCPLLEMFDFATSSPTTPYLTFFYASFRLG